ncbi:hypothetical protein A0J57_04190 [Sphingobium sp. 22B]|uniref:LLM class flavin-dependent oxidoreductase n=1 Tax=unclassified Sphingobium TaxID=2611147 RepID=UPI0007852EAD|nr:MULTISPECIES: LLM class flavin-dependent oxidoreductase [unclassified Sphingobium]KXU33845.1 hypothetical protein AXW74_00740 [Sphingobium sp. AM]KYC33789.1 hypothetical protein A0J57_04190 [Sphingobium sp. 22B]OAP33524.1 hypothetical protein A8O16_03410 [Sphingobium sp. 20006FA]
MEVILRYDLITSSSGPSTPETVAAVLEQSQWADTRGFSTAQFGEHHGTPCGYNPSPILLAGAVAARTRNLRIQPIIALPLYETVRLAEDLCLLDHISNGRLDVSVVLGYVPSEFEMFGIDIKERGRIADAKLAVLRQVFDGGEFEIDGRRGRITPGPLQPGGPALLIGGSLKATARRAARYGTGFYPMFRSQELIDEYERACAEFGKAPGQVYISDTRQTTIYVSEDPDRAWSQVAPYVAEYHGFYTAASKSAGQFTGFQDANDHDALRALGRYPVMTPEECIAFCQEETDAGNRIVICPLMGGMPLDLSWASLELFANKVIPAIRTVSAAA